MAMLDVYCVVQVGGFSAADRVDSNGRGTGVNRVKGVDCVKRRCRLEER